MSIPMLSTVAFAAVNAGGTFAVNRGFAGIVHNGAGDDTLELVRGIDAPSLAVRLTVIGAPGLGMLSYVRVDDTHIQVLQSEAVPTNRSFLIEVLTVEAD